jgi:UDP-N-acetylglucosamine 2-epimerase (non-hydrolysing)
MKAVMVVVGTRPEIIKMAPIIEEFQRSHVPYVFVHCGQHYDYNMSKQFIEDLQLPAPDYEHRLRAHSQSEQTARMMMYIEKLLQKTRPPLVLVEGDTNGVLAASLATIKLGVTIGHVEAGLRSFDLRMPEEHNRRLTDHLSGYLFAPTEKAASNLKRENAWGKIFVTGNSIIDAVITHLPIAEQKSRIMEALRFKRFALATAHRAENVDDPKVLESFIETFAEAPMPVVYPMHPRTQKRLKQNKIRRRIKDYENLQILPPLGYLDFLVLMKRCDMIVTDSGGIQEEATAPCLRKPVLVIRLSTERTEAVEAGFAEVVGTKKHQILEAMKRTMQDPKELPSQSPYGEGKAAQRIVMIIHKELNL